jgi:hypothetical protein
MVGMWRYMSSTEESSASTEIMEVAVEEQRRVYDQLASGYEQAKIKALTFLGGGLAAMTFLYSGRDLFIPDEIYGKIFYYVGLGLVIFAISTLFMSLKRQYWEFPTEYKDLKKLEYPNKKSYLEYVKQRYLECYEINRKAYEYKHKMLDTAFYPLVIGVTILIVLKLFPA